MKTFFGWIIIGLSVCMSVSAQGYGGRGGFGGGRGGYGGGSRGNRGNMGEMRRQSQSQDYGQVSITNFPEISGLTLKQKLDLSTAVTNEHKDILKLMDQKQELRVKMDHAANQKDREKDTKKMAKLDDKIQKVSQKTDKKIQSILTNEQYREFMEKKDQIKFGTIPSFRSGIRPTPPENGNQERMEQQGY